MSLPSTFRVGSILADAGQASSRPASSPAAASVLEAGANSPASILDALPDFASGHLRRLVARLNGLNETAHAYLVARGVEAAEAQACLQSAQLNGLRAELNEFIELANGNGFDGLACVSAAAREYGLGQFASFSPVSISKGSR
jgi:hypothetical protein